MRVQFCQLIGDPSGVIYRNVEESKYRIVEIVIHHFLISIFYFFSRAHEQRAHELEILVNSCYYPPLPEVPSVHSIITPKYYAVDGFEVGS